ncbi:hypothetical protein B5807_04988 [Epicoccum nigrum]|uniref:Uncharacterized protein n=1 Tax=Epicoccum nigrum TaxID=105696 RepID=A0A1Y2M226_EPING|nr:hypothetical protein B5807_04988 [Epicoccum nigrum]
MRYVDDLSMVTTELPDHLFSTTPRTPNNMPVHPVEETAAGSITDKIAKESKDSTASDHPLHEQEDQASANAHKANPGPVHADNLPEKASKEELKKRAEELNKPGKSKM